MTLSPEVIRAGHAIKAVKEQLLAIPDKGRRVRTAALPERRHARSAFSLRRGTGQLQLPGTSCRRGSSGRRRGTRVAAGRRFRQRVGTRRRRHARKQGRRHQCDRQRRRRRCCSGGPLSHTPSVPSTARVSRHLHRIWVEALTALAEHSRSVGAGGLTPSDVAACLRETTRYRRLRESIRYGDRHLAPGTAAVRFALPRDVAESSVDLYSVQMILTLSGKVDADRLRTAAQGIIDRYANLRTAFTADDDGTPVQIVLEDVPVPWRNIDLSDIAAVDREAALNEV